MDIKSTLDPNLVLTVYNNVNTKLSADDISSGDQLNFQELLNGFLSNEIFQNTLLSILPDNDPALSSRVATQIQIADNSEVTATSSMTYYLVDEMQAGNLGSLADLVDGYIPPLSDLEIDGLIQNFFVDMQSEEYFDKALHASDGFNHARETFYNEYQEASLDPEKDPYEVAYGATAEILKNTSGAQAHSIITQRNNIDLGLNAQTGEALTESNVIAMFESPVLGVGSTITSAEATLPKLTETNQFSTAVSTLSAPANVDAAPMVDKSVVEPPEDTFVWNDDAIVSTYDNLLTLNPESVTEASAVTQEAYGIVQPIIELQTQHAEYMFDPASYINNGNIPPTDSAIEAAENTAYEHLAGLSPQNGYNLNLEVSLIVENDAEFGLTPSSPDIIGGQQYLAGIGLDTNGIDFLETPKLETPPSIITPETDAAPKTREPSLHLSSFTAAASPAADTTSAAPLKDYEVKAGDNLWKIAKSEYGLTKATDIMRAVDHIAIANGMENGADANHIKIGEELKMPSAEAIKTDVKPGDWAARDADTQQNLSGGAPASMGQQGIAAAAPNI